MLVLGQDWREATESSECTFRLIVGVPSRTACQLGQAIDIEGVMSDQFSTFLHQADRFMALSRSSASRLFIDFCIESLQSSIELAYQQQWEQILT